MFRKLYFFEKELGMKLLFKPLVFLSETVSWKVWDIYFREKLHQKENKAIEPKIENQNNYLTTLTEKSKTKPL